MAMAPGLWPRLTMALGPRTCAYTVKGHLLGSVPRTAASLGTSSGTCSSARAPVSAAGGSRRRPGAPLWCGCCSSPTPVFGAAALGADWGISLGFVPRTAASLGTSSEAWSSARAPVGAADGGRQSPGAPLWCGCCSSLTPVLGAAALGADWGFSLGFVPRTAASLGTSSGALSSARARGYCRLGPSEASCAPLVWLLLLSDPGSWCRGTGRGLGQLPGLCSARGVVAGLEQRGAEQHGSPRGQLK